jgi:malonyl-CoA decarboxylase
MSEGPSAELERTTKALMERLSDSKPVVRRVTSAEPGDLLDRLVAAEPVHPIAGPADLADRLDEDRRCYVLEHPSLPGRPSNIVWVALWRGVASSMADLLDRSAPTLDPHSADTAVFYSIWGVEPGLVGYPGGERLITGAVEVLQAELPGLGTFVTLSPVPGFREWWEQNSPDQSTDGSGGSRPAATSDGELLGGCARYLTSLDGRGRPLDPVARFHLRNGARLLRLHRHGDVSDRGLARSYGIMANYRYQPEDRAANRARLADGRPAVGSAIAALLDGPAAPERA